jgi:hypothetical protein
MNPGLWYIVCAGDSLCMCVQTMSGNAYGKSFNFLTFFRILKRRVRVIKQNTPCVFHSSFLPKLNLLLFINTSFLLTVKEKSEWKRNRLLKVIEVCLQKWVLRADCSLPYPYRIVQSNRSQNQSPIIFCVFLSLFRFLHLLACVPHS